MQKKNPRIVARNMRWISIGLCAALILVLILCLNIFLSGRTAAQEYEDKISDLNSGLREIIVLRLDRQSDVYENCANYLSENMTTAMSAYLAGASDLSGTSDFTNAAWNRLFPDNKELCELCNNLIATTAGINADTLSGLSDEQRTTLSGLFQQLSDSLDRDSTITTLTALIGLAEPDAEAIQTEADNISALLNQVDTLLTEAAMAEEDTEE
ncbi:MAG: hypothetical protein IJ452_08170 [Butyricicoccus sp.]|nr:hypothetical protein [Butyricicoccus sp.]MBQ8586241.1 hypothetical protein [Butyricicoccus sp.]